MYIVGHILHEFFLVIVLQECYLENDYTTMYYAAQSLMTLQALYGVIPNINGKGDCAKVWICPITDDVTSTV